MMKSLIGAIAFSLAATTAFSADLYQPEQAPPPEVAVAQSSGWYLRGDVGYAFSDLRGANYFQGSNSNMQDFDSAKLDDSFTLGGGVGYQINDYLRTDATVDYLFKSDFKGSTKGDCGGCGPDFSAVAATSRDRSSLTAVSLLANAYVDIGHYGAFTPYVGGGLGGTYIKWDKLHNTSCSDADSSSCDETVTHNGRGSWRFTYALMAGTAIDLTCNLKADVGYRFRHIEGGDMFGFAENGGPGYDKGLNLHEARIGARYNFGGCQTASYMPPAEIPVAPAVYK
ncbi:outer membrane beta-barrel protein [Rhizobium sp. L80/93]|uniref:outer membrane protein n=1 Tax=unclassified Rhizobium TaxID=2613769 RepID=UPI001ADAE659|nr:MULTISPECIES: outer membrane protein [unclassified Rhizobium]MBO9170919.1 porin family protein [Rhizobium sp. L245/93]MBO9186820.1 porin family protein [Rhizobium sp. E27B/91]